MNLSLKGFSKIIAAFLFGLLVFIATPSNATISTVAVTAPNGAEKWSGTQNITWTSDGVGGDTVDIYYCHNDNGDCAGLTFTQVTSTAPNSGTYSWNTVGVTDGTDYKVRVTKAGSFLTGDLSNATFTIDNTAPTNQNVVFPSSVSKQGGASTAIVSSGDSTNEVWLSAAGKTLYSQFVASATTTKAADGVATTILAPATAGVYKLYVIDAAHNVSSASTATLTVDNTAPVITALAVTPSSGNSIVGQTVTLTITADAVGYTLSSGTVNGVAVTGFTDNANNTYTVTYTIVNGNNDRAAGAVPASVVLSDAAGNTNSAFTTVGVNTLAIDANKPIVSSIVLTPNSGTLKVGDIVTTTITADAAGYTASAITVNGVAVTGFTDVGGGVYTAIYTIVNGNTDRASGAVPASVALTDTAGNTNTASTTVTANTLEIDANNPTVTDGHIAVSGCSGLGGACKISDVVTATWTDTGGDANTDTIAGVTVNFTEFGGGAAVVATNSSGIWTASTTIVAGAIDDLNNNVSVTATDDAGNTTTASDTTNLAVDTIAPIITANGTLTIVTNNGAAGVAGYSDTVRQSAVTLNAADSDIATINLSALTGQSLLPTGAESNAITAGALDNAAQTFLITVLDNAGNVATTTSDALSVDNQLPVVSADKMTINTSSCSGTGGTCKIGDHMIFSWDNSGTGDNNADVTLVSQVSFDLTNFGGGAAVQPDSVSSGVFTKDFTVATGNDDGVLAYTTTAYDDASDGTTSAPSTATANVDDVAPTIGVAGTVALSSDVGTDGIASIGDGVTFAAGTPGSADGDSWTVNFSAYGLSATGTPGVYTVIAGNDSGAFAANESITDDAGNTVTGAATITGAFNIDNVIPTVTSITSNATGAGVLKVGNTILFTLTPGATEAGGTVSSSYNGIPLSWSTADAGVTFTATYTVVEGQTDRTSALQISGVVLSDAAKNTSTVAVGSDVVKTIDANSPTISSVTIPNSVMKIGDVVTTTITTGADTTTFTLTSGTVDGYALGNLTKVNSTTYTATFTVTSGGVDKAAGVTVPVASLVLTDSALNPSATFAASITQDSDRIDANRPTLSSWTLDLSTGHLVLTLSEAVSTSTLTTTGIAIQDAATKLYAKYTLTGGTTASVNGTEVDIALSAADLNVIKQTALLAKAIGTSYLTITTAVIQDTAGNADTAIANGSAQQASSYTADTTAPTVSATTPTHGSAQTGVLTNVSPTITFSKPINPVTISASSVYISTNATNNTGLVTAVVTMNADNTVATINPVSNLAAGTAYYLHVTTAVKDVNDNALAAQFNGSNSFTTAAAQTGIAATVSTLKSSATADGTYTNGWEFKMNVTVYDTSETYLKMKFADWASGSNSLAAVSNMKISLTDDIAGVQAGSAGVAVGNLYATQSNSNALSLVDEDPNTDGIQETVYVYVKVPASTAAGSYSTSFGIKTGATNVITD